MWFPLFTGEELLYWLSIEYWLMGIGWWALLALTPAAIWTRVWAYRGYRRPE